MRTENFRIVSVETQQSWNVHSVTNPQWMKQGYALIVCLVFQMFLQLKRKKMTGTWSSPQWSGKINSNSKQQPPVSSHSWSGKKNSKSNSKQQPPVSSHSWSGKKNSKSNSKQQPPVIRIWNYQLVKKKTQYSTVTLSLMYVQSKKRNLQKPGSPMRRSTHISTMKA